MATANKMIQQATQKSAVATTGKPALQHYIKQMEKEIKKALPSVITPERFTRIVLSALSTNPKLADTTPQSFLGAMMTATQLGVEPNTPLGQAYLIPYRNKGVMECQFQLGYKGLIDLAYRSGEISIIQAQMVYSEDSFTYSFGLEPTLKHIPATGDRGEPVHVYAMFKTKEGGYGFEVMSIEEIRIFAQKYSKAYDNGPWQTNFEEMAKKTVLKRVLKYAPLKTEFLRGLAQDETIKQEISDDMYMVQPTMVEDVIPVDSATGEVISSEP